MSDHRAAHIAINGADLWVESAGEGPAVVLLHAGIADSRMWEVQWPVVTHAFRGVRYDLRGYGRSSMPAGPYAHHEDLRAVLDALGIKSAVLVAASMAGEVALAFAQANPDRVDGLVLVNTRAGMPEPSAELQAGWAAVESAFDDGDLDRADEMELQMWVDGPYRSATEVDPSVRELVREMNLLLLQRELDGVEAEEQPPDPPVLDRLETVPCPVLVMIGTLDMQDIHTSADVLMSRLPHAHRVDVSNAAHLPSLERPEAFNPNMLQFLDSLGDR